MTGWGEAHLPCLHLSACDWSLSIFTIEKIQNQPLSREKLTEITYYCTLWCVALPSHY